MSRLSLSGDFPLKLAQIGQIWAIPKEESEKVQTEQNQQAIVALGSNLNEPKAQVENAIEILSRKFAKDFRHSAIYRTEAEGMAAHAFDFANAVVVFTTALSPLALLGVLQTLEVEFGRPSEHQKNSNRTLDLDLIALGDHAIASTELSLPHPRAMQRRFVLSPLAELIPDYRFPGYDVSLDVLLAQSPDLVMSIW
ncbi:MAG: 2-amino-4-hydroxy-6-hydroxymethyldihydropteridine diphosphokinase [Gammaproteobacteria bacterium TMED95]|nr:2-amino-4-hydroxy-6-hydroxymethyldihydropteridine diphosphokinase [Gammaproteobacteria bacterium]OUV22315.1 MAG: 2-amino-4-hydroxy-6-hydroxymethyldihydropteridine diphosphokinase [Gammaproteobacteria bacterium TMED95]